MSESTKIGDGLMLRCSDAPHLLVSLLNVVVEESFWLLCITVSDIILEFFCNCNIWLVFVCLQCPCDVM
ncbi:hypothetical protein ACFX2J_022975 [Malus domestica]